MPSHFEQEGHAIGTETFQPTANALNEPQQGRLSLNKLPATLA